MCQKIDNIYKNYKENSNIDVDLIDVYEIILAKLDIEYAEM